MVARAALFSLLENDPELPVVYGSGGVDTPPEEPFIIIRWELHTAEFIGHGPSSVLVWAHDKQPNYDRVDRILERVEYLLGEVTHLPGSDGWDLTQAKVTERSGDLYDDVFRTCTRYLGVRASSRYNGS